MVSRSVIGFDDDPLKDDVVTFAVAPIDALTGRIVPRNITVSVTVAGETAESEALKLLDKPIRNLSDLLVFINLDKHPKYRVHLKARAAGYFDPDPVEFTPLEPLERDAKNALELKDLLRIDFTLFPRPDFAFNEEATLISSVIIRGEEKVQGARISVIVSPPAVMMGNPRPPQAFETRSDERGAFTLALRLPAFTETEEDANGEDGADKGVPVKFRVKFRIETRTGDGEWKPDLEKDIAIIEGRRHVFKTPINITPDSKLPELLIQ